MPALPPAREKTGRPEKGETRGCPIARAVGYPRSFAFLPISRGADDGLQDYVASICACAADRASGKSVKSPLDRDKKPLTIAPTCLWTVLTPSPHASEDEPRKSRNRLFASASLACRFLALAWDGGGRSLLRQRRGVGPVSARGGAVGPRCQAGAGQALQVPQPSPNRSAGAANASAGHVFFSERLLAAATRVRLSADGQLANRSGARNAQRLRRAASLLAHSRG